MQQIAIDGAVGYDLYKAVKLAVMRLTRCEENKKGAESKIEWRHVVWELQGILDGAIDRQSPNTPKQVVCFISK